MGNLLRRLLIFLVVSVLFMFSMLVLRGLNDEPGIVFRLWLFRWTKRDLVHAVSLGFRILALVTMSMGFVLTTRPRDLVLSLIIQCKVSVVHGYATMATYRFLPELQSQVDSIWRRKSAGYRGTEAFYRGLHRRFGYCSPCCV